MCRDDEDDNCNYGEGNFGAGNARSSDIGNHDAMTTFKLRKYNWAEQGVVLLFEHPDCKGTFGRLYTPTEFGHPAEYLKSDIEYNNIYNDKVSSVMIAYGTSATFYEHDSW